MATQYPHILLLPVFAFGLQMAERKANHNLDSFSNALWLALTSVTSLGFGDFVPLSPLGRAIDAVAIGWGLLLYADNILSLTPNPNPNPDS